MQIIKYICSYWPLNTKNGKGSTDVTQENDEQKEQNSKTDDNEH